MIAAIQALFRPRPNDASTRADVMAAAKVLARTIQAREAFLAATGANFELSRTRLAHRALEKVAAEHGPPLGFDVTGFSGTGPKGQ